MICVSIFYDLYVMGAKTQIEYKRQAHYFGIAALHILLSIDCMRVASTNIELFYCLNLVI